MKFTQFKELLLQSLVHERGGVLIYQTALECVVNEDLRKEWEEYLEQTKSHVEALTRVCDALELDPGEMTPGCLVVQHNGKSLVAAMKMALGTGDALAAELVACDCVMLAETKDHANWQLLGKCAEALEDEAAAVLQTAYDEIEEEEDEHLYHTQGWCRELWLQSLGLATQLPPPEDVEDVKDAVGADTARRESEAARGHAEGGRA